MSNLQWRDGHLPVSTRFDDPYYSKEDGRAETSYVFINGNNLPSRWPIMETCTIAELGFGTGLNFLETVHQWQENTPNKGQLRFISFEQFPITKEDMFRALSNWPQLETLSNSLIEIWEPESEKIDIEFADNIYLTIHMGDANALLPSLNFKADAWYLDGFSPAKNPELWNDFLLQEVANHTKPEGTFATYTAAGFVKRALEASGFNVKKVAGFGKKRDMLIGTYQATSVSQTDL